MVGVDSGSLNHAAKNIYTAWKITKKVITGSKGKGKGTYSSEIKPDIGRK